VTIPASVTNFGWWVFWSCEKLTVYGYENSAIEQYVQAGNNNVKINFSILGEPTTSLTTTVPTTVTSTTSDSVTSTTSTSATTTSYVTSTTSTSVTSTIPSSITTTSNTTSISTTVTTSRTGATTTVITTTTDISIEDSKRIVFGKDNFSFENVTGTEYFNTGYGIGSQYLEIIDDDLNTIENLVTKYQTADKGHCFGMASFVALAKSKNLDVEYFQEGAENVWDLKIPKENPNLEYTINYFHLLQYINNDYTSYFHASIRELQRDKEERIIQKLTETKLPSILTFTCAKFTHEVTVFDLTEDENGDYVISAADPNNNETVLTITISKDFSNVTTSNKSYNNGLKLYNVLTLDDPKIKEIDGFLNFQEILENGNKNVVNRNYSSGMSLINLEETSNTESSSTDSSDDELDISFLETNYTKFIIVKCDSNGKEIGRSFVDFNNNDLIVEGDIEIYGIPTNEMGYDLELLWFVPTLKKEIYFDGKTTNQKERVEYYKIIPEAFDLSSGKQINEYKTTLTYNKAVDGFMSDISLDKNSIVNIRYNGEMWTENIQIGNSLQYMSLVTNYVTDDSDAYRVDVFGDLNKCTFKFNEKTQNYELSILEETDLTLIVSNSLYKNNISLHNVSGTLIIKNIGDYELSITDDTGKETPVPLFTRGDIDADDEITITDLVSLKKIVLGNNYDTKNSLIRADINKDEKVNAIDFAIIKNTLLYK
ncbi:MAG: dockerin type I repeat-containing protein, partial [Oscillospiraceae bacterium]|nr:dockerin type I repeat-containing protein [Oscillospiraceae bacterium]